jgi:hypothetical protein
MPPACGLPPARAFPRTCKPSDTGSFMRAIRQSDVRHVTRAVTDTAYPRVTRALGRAISQSTGTAHQPVLRWTLVLAIFLWSCPAMLPAVIPLGNGAYPGTAKPPVILACIRMCKRSNERPVWPVLAFQLRLNTRIYLPSMDRPLLPVLHSSTIGRLSRLFHRPLVFSNSQSGRQ